MDSRKPWKIYKHKLAPLRTACSCNALMNYHQMTWTLIRFKRIVGYSSNSSANLTSHIFYSVPQLTLPKASDNNAPPSPPVTAPCTRWDEIRATNNRNVQNSSWDKLRQAHERNQIKSEEFMGDISSEKIDADPYDNPRSRRPN